MVQRCVAASGSTFGERENRNQGGVVHGVTALAITENQVLPDMIVRLGQYFRAKMLG